MQWADCPFSPMMYNPTKSVRHLGRLIDFVVIKKSFLSDCFQQASFRASATQTRGAFQRRSICPSVENKKH